MSHFAHITNGIVDRVIVAEQDFIDSGAVGEPSEWVQTSYSTVEGEHKDGGVPIRKNYAGVGYTYDEKQDCFIPPKVDESFVFDEVAAKYLPPIPMPKDGKEYIWAKDTQGWKHRIDLKVILGGGN